MIPLEQLLNNTENRDAYERMLLSFDNFVPYVGTGLSFYCTSWGAPFEKIYQKIKDSRFVGRNCFYQPLDIHQQENARKVIEDIIGPITDPPSILLGYIQQAVARINKEVKEEKDRIVIVAPDKGDEKESEKIWNQLWELYNKKRFLELGELLNIISFTYTEKTFDLWFQETIEWYEKNGEEKVSEERKHILALININNTEQLPPSRWFLPYLGQQRKMAITTNTDNSLGTVYSGHAIYPVPISGKSTPEQSSAVSDEHMMLFHIHGYQPRGGVDCSKSFIMTWSDYRKAYHIRQGFSRDVLEQVFTEDNILFIGASLDKDVTVDIMRESAQKRALNGKHVAFLSDSRKGQALEIERTMATRVFLSPDKPSYSTILCQLIRETHAEWNIFQNILANCSKCDEAYTKSIAEFLNSEKPFDQFNEDIEEGDLETKLYPALRPHIQEKRIRNFKWSICRVADDNFAFPIKNANEDEKVYYLDTYSAPLGSTIYIIGGIKNSQDKINELIMKIKSWTDSHNNGYWESDSMVKVRIFTVSAMGKLPPEVVIQRLDAIISMAPEECQTAITELLSEMRSIKAYARILDACDFSLDTDELIVKILNFLSILSLFSRVRQDIKKLESKYNNLLEKRIQDSIHYSVTEEDEAEAVNKPYEKNDRVYRR